MRVTSSSRCAAIMSHASCMSARSCSVVLFHVDGPRTLVPQPLLLKDLRLHAEARYEAPPHATLARVFPLLLVEEAREWQWAARTRDVPRDYGVVR